MAQITRYILCPDGGATFVVYQGQRIPETDVPNVHVNIPPDTFPDDPEFPVCPDCGGDLSPESDGWDDGDDYEYPTKYECGRCGSMFSAE